VKGKPVKLTARTHAGFAPVSLCTFSYLVDPVKAAQAEGVLDKERAYKMKNDFGDPAGMIFEMEPECGLTPKYLVSKALELIMDRLKKLSSLDNIISKATPQGMEYTFQNEDDTLGNLLQTYMFQKYIRDKKLSPSGDIVSYVGYYCPHPLDSTMVIRIFIKDDKDPNSNQEAYRNILQDAIREVDMQLQIIQQNWGSFTQGK
jgi:DNA-directed RNA polymerase subunit L